MSRKHKGQSIDYSQKKMKRNLRIEDRVKLLLAKRKFFYSLNLNYDKLFETKEGKAIIQKKLDRGELDKFKKAITKEEIN